MLTVFLMVHLCICLPASSEEIHLRRVEVDVLIPKLMREKAKERCAEQVEGVFVCLTIFSCICSKFCWKHYVLYYRRNYSQFLEVFEELAISAYSHCTNQEPYSVISLNLF